MYAPETSVTLSSGAAFLPGEVGTPESADLGVEQENQNQEPCCNQAGVINRIDCDGWQFCRDAFLKAE